ncbi:MAG: hypothetical protein O9267_13845, partial [Flavobacterium sp.]|uniref:hypothetical protein n=1 Tax=Flavobacterium sp. TaxID=239 RepID=UPI0022CA2FDC
MSKSEQIKELLLKLNSNENQLELINSIDEIIISENKKYDTYSKLIYDIFLDILTGYNNKNYSF